MAQVDVEIHAEVGRLLDFLCGEYEWAIQRGAMWGEDQILSFIAEQPLRDEALDDLHAYARRDVLNSEQRTRLEQLEQYLAQHRDQLDALLDS